MRTAIPPIRAMLTNAILLALAVVAVYGLYLLYIGQPMGLPIAVISMALGWTILGLALFPSRLGVFCIYLGAFKALGMAIYSPSLPLAALATAALVGAIAFSSLLPRTNAQPE